MGEAPPTSTHWLNRNIAAIATTSFFSDLSHETATAILPVFLASIGAAPSALGIIEGVADAISSFAKMGAGYWSDRLGIRKPIAVIGYLFTALGQASFGFATHWTHVLAGRTAGWFGRGIRGPVRDAIASESTEPQHYGKVFGFDRTLDTLGAILGPSTALALVAWTSYRNIFFLTFIPGLLAVLTVGFLVKAKKLPPNPTLSFRQSLRNLPPDFRFFLVGVGIFGAGDFAHTLLILRASQMLTPAHGPATAAKLAISLYLIHNIIYAAASYPVGYLADRFGKRRFLAAGYFISGLMCAGFLFPISHYYYLGILFALAGLFIAIEDALERAIAAELLPAEVRASGYGVLATINGVGDFVSSVVVGLLWAHVSTGAGFLYSGILSIIGAFMIARVRKSN
ncbi:MAG: MFS transporter [Acidobacteriia bacterium]|nr:MFS transporter [Terriglobia bacterium]